ncbi:MAG: hypothetical protein CMJ41_02100 [Phycisphaerae bacterium]|nr:hypothetical protein [Phycisphaerae bacterium]
MPTMNLSRCVRLTVPADPDRLRDGKNTFAGTPLSSSLGAYFEFTLDYTGEEAPETGYVFSIYDIDRAIRIGLPQLLAQGLSDGVDPVTLMPSLRDAVTDEIGQRPRSMRWTLNPYHELIMHEHDTTHLTLSRRYSFSASHRLSLPGLSDEENYERFGKCSRPNGHGHNYELEVHARIPIQQSDFDSIALDEIITDGIIDHLDHRNLNLDVQEFMNCNPTLERITVYCHQIISESLTGTPAQLERVRVWENDRTACSYPPAPTPHETTA